MIVGPPSGQISQLISKVTAIQNKHGKFEAMFINGDFFSPGVERENETETTGEDSQSDEKKLIEGHLNRESRKTYLRIQSSFKRICMGEMVDKS